MSGPHPIPCLQDKRVNSVLPQLDGLRQDENQFNAAFVLSQCRTPKPQQQRHSLRTFISLQNPFVFLSLLLEFPKRNLNLTGFINT